MAAEEGYAPAQFNIYISELEKDVKWLEKAAEKGYAPAQNELGALYYSGKNGVVRNPEKAVEFFRKAAHEGYAKAQFHLGVCYERGMGVKQNYMEAFNWYEKSAKQGYGPAQFNLGALFHFNSEVGVDEDEAIKWYLMAARNDEVEAQNNLGALYQNLGDEANAEHEEDGQNGLSGLWNKGRGNETKLEEANRWFLRAAQQGSAVAQRNIGSAFEKGKNEITKNDEEAYFWYSLALKDKDTLNKQTDINDLADKTSEVRKRIELPNLSVLCEVEKWKPKQFKGSGTGFYISKHYILTNAHVLLDQNRKALDEFRIPYRRVEVVVWDPDADLALLYDNIGNEKVAVFSLGRVSFGEEVTVFGYPQSNSLSFEGNIAPGIVSGTSSIVDTSQFENRFQHTAPTQGGNSGGPVFDSEGYVVGVSVSGLLDPYFHGYYGQYLNRAQNINFAIKSNVVGKFISDVKVGAPNINFAIAKDLSDLDDLGFPVQTEFHFGSDSDSNIQVPSITLSKQRAKAKEFTVPIMCYKNKEKSPLKLMEVDIDGLMR